MKKFLSKVLAVSLTAMLSIGYVPNVQDSIQTVSAEETPNYATALQQSLYFYECQQAGPLPDWNRVEWRADSTVDDYVTGGWYDAGDHVKFNLPMAYSTSMLAWGLYQYGDGVEEVGQYETYKNNLEFALDYFVDCDNGDDVVFQVGNGTEDHTWWGPVELIIYGLGESNNGSYVRPYYTTDDKGYSAVLGEMASALASGSVALKGKSDKTDKYLELAIKYFNMADAQKSDDGYNSSNAQGFYQSSSFYDDLFYSANWLYIATGDTAYLDKATSYIPNLGTELGTNELKYSWAHCWDDVMQGGMLLYAQNTNDQTYINHVKKHLDYWCNDVQELEGGFKWLTTWGCLRYSETTAFLSEVACDTILSNDSNKDKYIQFAEDQVNYALGENPDRQSYVVGYTPDGSTDYKTPHNPHHRSAHSSWCNSLDYPEDNTHTLYGALVGGPTQNGEYEDSRGNYINNEVACDYNAGFTAVLCKMVSQYGGKTDSSFPPTENVRDEFYVEACNKQSSDSTIGLSLKFTNVSCSPPRIEDNMSFRYYLDISEVLDAGFSASDVVIRVDRDQSAMYSELTSNAIVSELTQYQGSIYYVEITYPDGRIAMPISEGRYQCETMLAIVYPNYQSGWDVSNDYSFQDLADATEGVKTDKITVYQNGVLVFGTEPDGTTAKHYTEHSSKYTKPNTNEPTTETSKVEDTTVTTKDTTVTTDSTTDIDTSTTTPSEEVTTTVSDSTTINSDSQTTNSPSTETLLGDANCDGKVSTADLLLIKKYLLGISELEGQGYINADLNQDGSVKTSDLINLKKTLLGIA